MKTADMILIMTWFIIVHVSACSNVQILKQHITETCTTKAILAKEHAK
jgi:hypothetical protein